MVTNIIRNEDFIGVAKRVKVDSKRRLVLPRSLVQDDVTFHIYTNSVGQIVLDPQVTIPASELWVFENKEILASIDKGMVESINGQVVNRGSFAKYVNNET
jgi:hypothetical protein